MNEGAPTLAQDVIPNEQPTSQQSENPLQPFPQNDTLETTTDMPVTRELLKPTKDNLQAEAQIVIETVLEKKYKAMRKGKKEDDPRTPQEEALNTALFFKKHLEDPNLAFDPIIVSANEKNPLRLRATADGGMAMKEKGQPLTAILEKKVLNGQVFFMCELQGMDKPLPVHASELIKAQYFEEGEAIVESIEDADQKKLAVGFMASLDDPNQDLTFTSKDLAEVAKKTGFISSEATFNFINKSNLSTEAKGELITLIDGSTVATPEALGKILHKMNDLETNYNAKKNHAEKIEREIHRLDTVIAQLEPDSSSLEGLRAQRDGLKIELITINTELPHLQELSEASAIPESTYIQLIKSLYEGEGNEAKIGQLENAMEQGDMKNMLENLLQVVPKDHKDYDKYKGYIETAIQYGGLAIMAMVAIMVMQGMQSMKG